MLIPAITRAPRNNAIIWTADLDAYLREQRAVGIGMGAIAVALGTSKNVVSGRMQRIGISKHGGSNELRWTPEALATARLARMARWSLERVAKLLLERHGFRVGATTLRDREMRGWGDVEGVVVEPLPPCVVPPVKARSTKVSAPVALPLASLPTPPRAFHPIASIRGCQWPHGHPGTPSFRFCGESPVAGRAYCREHMDRAYVRWSECDA